MDINLLSFFDELDKIASESKPGVLSRVGNWIDRNHDNLEITGLGGMMLPYLDDMHAKRVAKKAGLANEHGSVDDHVLDKFRYIPHKYHGPLEVGMLGLLMAPNVRNKFKGGTDKHASFAKLAGGAITPKGRLAQSRAVGLPKVTAPSGPEINDMVPTFGKTMPGTHKDGIGKRSDSFNPMM